MAVDAMPPTTTAWALFIALPVSGHSVRRDPVRPASALRLLLGSGERMGMTDDAGLEWRVMWTGESFFLHLVGCTTHPASPVQTRDRELPCFIVSDVLHSSHFVLGPCFGGLYVGVAGVAARSGLVGELWPSTRSDKIDWVGLVDGEELGRFFCVR